MTFVLGLVGVIIMARKESPTTLGSVRGKWAVAQGALITAAFWLAALYLMLSGSEPESLARLDLLEGREECTWRFRSSRRRI